MAETITFTVHGKPKGKGRPRFTRHGHAYTPATTKAAEEEILRAYLISAGTAHLHTGPVHAAITAIFQPPAKLRKQERQRLIDDAAPHLSKPDADNIAKLVLDSLNGYLFLDDGQVSNLVAEKYYGDTAMVVCEFTLLEQ